MGNSTFYETVKDNDLYSQRLYEGTITASKHDLVKVLKNAAEEAQLQGESHEVIS